MEQHLSDGGLRVVLLTLVKRRSAMNTGPKITLRKAQYLNLRYGKKDKIFLTKRNCGLVLIHVMKTKMAR
jgi:hypothetical protein